jgi:aminomethyltransferase
MNDELKRTVLHGAHRKLGAQMTPFGGWDMPVRYSGDIAEHKSVRERAGIFDVSHMGRFAVRGRDAHTFLDSVFTNHVAALKIGQAHYGFLCNTSGGVVDDVICYRRGENFYWLVVNAGNRDKDWQWLMSRKSGDMDLQNVSDEWALMALQGPQALSILANFTDLDFNTIPYYHCADTQVAGHEAFVARTGYTGEDGVELAVRSDHAIDVWTKLLEAGATPCGLGARDTLRLEVGMALYGHELTDTTNPLEANLKRFIKLDKRDSSTGALCDFVGRDWLEQSLKDGLKKKLVGLVMSERGIARAGYVVQSNGHVIGALTSGGPSITTGQNIALAYVPVEHSKLDTLLDVMIRDKPVKAKVVKTPFYTRKK